MNTDEFLLEVEREVGVPSYQARFSSDDVLKLASKHQRITVVPAILALQEDYFVLRTTAAVTALDPNVQIPLRATGRSVRGLSYSVDGTSWYPLPRVDLSGVGWSFDVATVGTPDSHVFLDDQIRLIPTPSQSGNLAIMYEAKPSNLTEAKLTATVTSSAGPVFTVARRPAGIIGGSVVDITKGSGGHRTLHTGLTVNAVTTSSISFVTAPASVSVGDVISLTGETSIVQLPDEATDVLVLATGMQILQSLGLSEQADILQGMLKAAMSAMNTTLSPRNQSSPQKIKLQGTIGARRGNRALLIGGY